MTRGNLVGPDPPPALGSSRMFPAVPTYRSGIFGLMAKAAKTKPTDVGKKTSIYLDASVEAMLAAREGPKPEIKRHGQRAHIIKRIIRRYDEICLQELPAGLSDRDWQTVLAAASESIASDEADPMAGILKTLMREGTHEDLVHQLAAFSTAQRFAIVDFLERHRAAEERGQPPPRPPKKSAATLRKAV